MTGEFFAGLRSLLFAPGDDPRKLANAFASQADAVIADLEDAVSPEHKALARRRAVESLGRRGPHPARLVRVNAPDTAWGREDLAALRDTPIDGLVVPKASAATITLLDADGPPVIALIETAGGLRRAYEIASHPRVVALMLGGADLGGELGWQPRADGLELLYARSSLVVDAVAAGLRAPFDVVFLGTRDHEGLRAEAEFARSLGYRGKACIHPAQVPVVNAVFSPTTAEVAQARAIVAAYEDAQRRNAAVTTVGGRLVDAPVVAQASAVLSRAAWLSDRDAGAASAGE